MDQFLLPAVGGWCRLPGPLYILYTGSRLKARGLHF